MRARAPGKPSDATSGYTTFSGSTLSVIAKSAFLRPFEQNSVKGNFSFAGSAVELMPELRNVRLSEHGEVRFKSLGALINFVSLKRKVDLDEKEVGLLVARLGSEGGEGKEFEPVLTDSQLVRVLDAWSKEGTSRLKVKLQRALKECERQVGSGDKLLQETGAHALWELGLRGTNHSAVSERSLSSILALLANVDVRREARGGPDIAAAAAGALWSLTGTVAVTRRRMAELGAVDAALGALREMAAPKQPPMKAVMLLVSALLVLSQDAENIPKMLRHAPFLVSLVKQWSETSLSPRIAQLLCRIVDGKICSPPPHAIAPSSNFRRGVRNAARARLRCKGCWGRRNVPLTACLRAARVAPAQARARASRRSATSTTRSTASLGTPPRTTRT